MLKLRLSAKIGKMGEEKNKTDDDILRCKLNILRAKDIIPPFGAGKQKAPTGSSPETERSSASSDDEPESSRTSGKTPIKISSIPEFEEIMPASTQGDIPQFNLAEQIFAEQRKVSSGRRQRISRAPRPEGQEQIDKPGPFGSAGPWQSSPPAAIVPSPASPQQRIISEIIARDIKEMLIRNSRLKS